MVTKGAFGYIIGKKKRLMPVNDDADLLWQLLVREIYVLMKHYKSIDDLMEVVERNNQNYDKISVIKSNNFIK